MDDYLICDFMSQMGKWKCTLRLESMLLLDVGCLVVNVCSIFTGADKKKHFWGEFSAFSNRIGKGTNNLYLMSPHNITWLIFTIKMKVMILPEFVPMK